jgi:hypothetical protein
MNDRNVTPVEAGCKSSTPTAAPAVDALKFPKNAAEGPERTDWPPTLDETGEVVR